MEKVINEVGPSRVAAVVTDNVANARRSQDLLKAVFKHLIVFKSWRIRVVAEGQQFASFCWADGL
jgi:hypothetical protein